MKKRFILKKWVEYVFITLQFMLLLILIAESDNILIFIISKVIALIFMYINHNILVKYTRLCD